MPAFISSVYATCHGSFKQLIEIVQSPEFDKYKTWVGNVGAAHAGKRYEISLNYRLREASFVRDQVLAFFNTLVKNLSDATSVV
ncbi:hypothetical protein K458DRAFT_385091 [Lentithecium fluviatile CBS 122367]|uniref:Uncharacterized protein n=1 Tax=Lentithecium fluviatile CBS 122367 TaxID=1168545 RepID=A0A6G1JFM2_9PLEO|nr:hypothetical protein K458DRAFT_385091 [Lentithecium fluviatile CBS 122367]